jgi:hypothetical protein
MQRTLSVPGSKQASTLLNDGAARSDTTTIATTKTTAGKAIMPTAGFSIPIAIAAAIPMAAPAHTQAKLTAPSRVVRPRVKNATQPTNIAQTGNANTRLDADAAAAVTAAAAENAMYIAGDCFLMAVLMMAFPFSLLVMAARI